MSRSGKTLYALFGVTPTADQALLDAQYLALQKQLGEIIDPVQRRRRLEQLDEAYQQLSNPIRRKIYDASLQAGEAQTVQLHQPRPAAGSGKRFDGGSRSLLTIGLVLLGVFILGYLYFAWRQQSTVDSYRQTIETAQQRAFSMQEKFQQQQQDQEARMMAAEREASGGTSPAWNEAEYKAKQEQERRTRENDDWARRMSAEQQRAVHEAEYKEKQRRQERERENRQEEAQQQRDHDEAANRIENERSQQFSKLMAEKRFDEARRLAKTSYEFERVKNAEARGY
ncbi:hypothetical protein FNU76_11605 [Chitinimonas arctica]|uniref:J domain-containing protein n=1 Tax=Chitinimonas arctica TaxID=2594795 RepID=A0A516SFL3_9NEIS|nr:hypothetical protein [Chitinimonas arctica]QDQ26955.1 hypothetical protein FNU76_11605 [Chitinimonas arctica]